MHVQQNEQPYIYVLQDCYKCQAEWFHASVNTAVADKMANNTYTPFTHTTVKGWTGNASCVQSVTCVK